MKPIVEYVGFRGQLLVRETWRATTLFCPRCGKGQGHVWEQQPSRDNPVLKADLLELRLFLCISCGRAGWGWSGFNPNWSVQDRAAQIIEHAFGESEE